MKCPHCHKEHEEDIKYCPYTGEEITPLKSCPNPQCMNYGKYILPSDYLFCPRCRTSLAKEVRQENYPVLPECKYDVVLVAADKNAILEIERKLGITILHKGIKDVLFPDKVLGVDINSVLPYTLKRKIAENKARQMKNEIEKLGACAELQRLNSSSISDFRKGNIFVNNVVLGKTNIEELLTKKEYVEILNDQAEEKMICLSLELSEGINASIHYVNPQQEYDSISKIKAEYEKMFVTPSEANMSFVENKQYVVNYIETSFEAMPCFAEMGIDDDIFYVNEGTDDRPAEEVEKIIGDIITSNGWLKIENFLRLENLFAEKGDILKSIFRCSVPNSEGNITYMLFFVSPEHYFGGWDNCRIIFAINLER